MDTQHESTDQDSEPTSSERGASQPKPPLLPTSRILLFLILAIMIAAWVADRQARRASKSAFDALEDALGDEQTRPSVKREEVQRLVGRQPEDDGDPDDVYEQYSWQGVPYKQIVYVVYSSGKQPMMKDVSLNQPPR